MSPRAACRLESLGFEAVFDYSPGKTDWLANGLGREGTSQKQPYAGDLAHSIVTCGPADTIERVRERTKNEGRDMCIVIDMSDVVLGILHGDALSKEASAAASDVMESAPQTFRANEPLRGFVEKRSHKDVKTVIVTDPKGKLLGVVDRHELEQAVDDAPDPS